MVSITQVATIMQEILEERANVVARETGFMEHERVVTGSSFLVGLVSGWQADPQASLSGLSQAIGNAGTPISRQGVHQRFTQKATSFLRKMVEECMQAMIKTEVVDQRLPARLIAERLPDEIVAQRRERILKTARKKQQTPSARALHLAQWAIYLTNVSVEHLPFEQVVILGRYRWQIELIFKLWKSDLHLANWQTSRPERIFCEIFAKLIVAIVTHWLLLVGCWHRHSRSLCQAMPSVHALAWQWANSLGFKHALHSLRRALSCCYLEPSKSTQRPWQSLLLVS